MSTIWDDMEVWVDRVSEVTLAAVDQIGNQSLLWLDEALAGHDPEEVREFLDEMDRVPLMAGLLRNARTRRVQPAEPGDVIGVERLGYTHFGIYVSHDEVIHYRGEQEELGLDARVRATPLVEFLRDDPTYFVLDMHEWALTNQEALEGVERYEERFTPAEVIRRARGRVGEARYNLVFNNCEHFALWCKTGEHTSQQVGDVVALLGRLMAIAVQPR